MDAKSELNLVSSDVMMIGEATAHVYTSMLCHSVLVLHIVRAMLLLLSSPKPMSNPDPNFDPDWKAVFWSPRLVGYGIMILASVALLVVSMGVAALFGVALMALLMLMQGAFPASPTPGRRSAESN